MNMEKPTMSYWSKFHYFGESMRRIWIGPMTREEMLEYDDTFRHASSTQPPAASAAAMRTTPTPDPSPRVDSGG
jgi:hypothetical protein